MDGTTSPEPGPGDEPVGTLRAPRWPRVVVVVVGVLAALVFGVTTASVEGNLGPHQARYDVTTDSTVTLDLGPLGTLEIDSPLPLTLGVRVTVQEIPESFTQLDRPTTLQALNGDLQGYLQLFSAPQATVQNVARELVVDVAGRTVGALAVLVAAWWLGRLALGAARRRELVAVIAPHRRAITAGGLVVVVGATVLTSSVGERDRPSEAQPASAVFDDTPLEGARVTGRLGGVIDTYGGQVVAAYRANEQFYATAKRSLDEAWDARDDLDQELADLRPTESPSPTGTPTPEPVEPVVLVLVSDLHCNVGMAPLVRDTVRRVGADLVLDAGDTTMNGTTVEQYCVTTFARSIPKSVELVTSPGNHDSSETSATYAKAGATVLGGKVVEVDGLRILGDSDPNETRVGSGTSSAGRESASDEGKRLADVACDDEDGVDLLLIHTPSVGQAALDSGCVPAQMSGHLHQRIGPLVVGGGVRYISASTAGATLGEPTIGPLHGVAEMTVLRWDPQERRFLDYQIVQVRPDTSVSVSPRLQWPDVFPSGPRLPTSGVSPSPV
ncbi:metallophosphoesterase [Cellulomonas sp.]|uniref:metallophosphoesterase family protein n=1 Tax=Cellulomonas sp. TaxID=40001 RepID=UPI001B1C06D8|nr:metallophosphoesterase [Cellulomonas sp.]MBO9555186.1 metallophosphoesterase family protein [Cellulomonas sp.]